MTRVNPTPEQLAEVARMVKAGRSVPNIMEQIGLTERVARRVVKEVRKELGVAPDYSNFRQRDLDNVAASVSDYYRKAVSEEARTKLAKRLEVREVKLPARPCAIATLADIHLGASLTNYAALDRDIELILNTPDMYVVLGGDGIDNHVKHLAAIIAQRITPGEQWAWYADLLARLAPKLLAVVGGNHEAWTVSLTGYEPLKHLTALHKVPYDANGMRLKVSVGSTQYDVSLRHKYRFNSTMNASHSVKRMWEQHHTYDVGIVCDKHEYTCEPFDRDGRMRWALRPGAYQVRVRMERWADSATPCQLLRALFSCPISMTRTAPSA